MNIDAKRHKLLGILTEQRKNNELKKEGYNALGVTFENIYSGIDSDDDELHSITSDLYTSEEIGYYDAYNIVGLFAKDKGLTAFANKKYHNRVTERRKEKIKFLVQTAIPVLALLIAIITLSTKFNSLKMQSDEELQKLESVIKEQEQRINKLEKRPYNNLNVNNDTDSLKVGKN
jgi:cell division protein FtsL